MSSAHAGTPAVGVAHQPTGDAGLPSDAARLRELRDLLQVVASGDALTATLERIALWIERVSPGSLCSVHLLDALRTHVCDGAGPSIPMAYRQAIDGTDIGPGQGSCGTAAYTALPVIVSDIANDPLWVNFRDLALSFGLRACWSYPILSTSDHVLGTFAVYRTEPALPSAAELEMLKDAAGIAALVIERAHADAARLAHERGIMSILENAIDVIVRSDTNARFTYVNSAALRVFGVAAERMLGRNAAEAGFPDDACRMYEQVLRIATETRLPHRIEYAFSGATGEVWLDALIAPEFDDAGVLKGFVIIARDVTARRRAEEALRTSEERLRTVFNTTDRSIALLDTRGHFIDVGDPAYNVTGLTRQEILGQPFWEMPTFVGIKESQDTLRSAIEAAAAGKVSLGEVTFRRPDGTDRFGWFTVQPIRNGEGEVVQLLMEGSDHTERRELERRLRQSEKMESLGRLAGGIAHDFNNILASILGHGELLRADVRPDTESESSVEHILASTRRARDLVRQILAFSRKADIVHAPIDLGVIVGDVVRLLRSSLPSTIELRDTITRTPLVVMGDGSQLSQVLLNLGSNAEYAMRASGHGRLDVELDLVRLDERSAQMLSLAPGPYARIIVRDSGSGIPLTVLPSIFEPFFTTKPVGEGTGMGLAVVHGIVTGHGGSVRVQSQTQGTSFEIHIPLAATPTTVEAQRSPTVQRGSGRVLVVDDEEAIIAMLRRVLPHRGYDAVCCTSPVEAVALFDAAPYDFDVVVTDRTMPRMTGEALAEHVHAVRPELPVIMCSGQGTFPGERDEERHLFHLAKPFELAE
ncbi:MAG: PAS domain S-box protein, partial [Gemmatimonadaceae bacterium]|nr:PAS domain S-box protein [Gemmatimonadaceae bacterium]